MAGMYVIQPGGYDGWEDVYYDTNSTVSLCEAFECVTPTVFDSQWCRAHQDPSSSRKDCNCLGCKKH